MSNGITTTTIDGAFTIGEGATECLWSDRHAGTIVNVVNKGRTVFWQRDKATRTDDLGMTDSGQQYAYESDPTAPVSVFTLRKNGRFIQRGESMHNGRCLIRGRHEFYDYSF